MDPKEILKKHVVVEGHRDVYELLYRGSIGEQTPLRDAIAPMEKSLHSAAQGP